MYWNNARKEQHWIANIVNYDKKNKKLNVIVEGEKNYF